MDNLVKTGSTVAASSVGIFLAYWKVRHVIEELEIIADDVAKKSEQLAIDGTIDRADRKQIAWTFVDSAATRFHIKLGTVKRWLLGFVIDYVAKKLPDFSTALKSKA